MPVTLARGRPLTNDGPEGYRVPGPSGASLQSRQSCVAATPVRFGRIWRWGPKAESMWMTRDDR